jgi:segregation and condensation protein B
MNNITLKSIIEALLLSADRPLSANALVKLLADVGEINTQDVKAAVTELQQDLSGRAFDLLELASGYRLQVKADFTPWVLKLWEERPPRYTRATLETLAIIAYRQPVTRAEIEDIRGVAVSSSMMRSLLEREWIKCIGHREVPGKPGLYATTKQFLDNFNLEKLDQLPPLAEIKALLQAPDSDVQAVQLQPADPVAMRDTDECH